MDALLRDVAHGLRQMRRSPVTSLVAVVCLGLGIGVTTAVFGIANAVLLRPMAVVDAERLVLITRDQGEPFAYDEYRAFRERTQLLAGVVATVPMESDLEVNGDSDIAVAEVVSADYGAIMGVTLSHGRWFTRDDEWSAVISDAVWEQKFGRAPDVIGRGIASESQVYTIVGVAPPTFGGVFTPARTDLWVPLRTRPRLFSRLEEHTPFGMLMLFGRLRDEATREQASAELRAIDRQLARAPGQPLSAIVADTVRGQPNRGGRAVARRLTFLLGAVAGTVLLIACSNVSHLLLARGAARRRELTTRLALGASRSRVMQQLMVEAMLLALSGAVVGTVLASWATHLLRATFPASLSVFALHVDLSLDWRALVFTSAVALLAATLSGLVPALRVSAARPDEAFKGRLESAVVRSRPLGVLAQVVMSLVLLFVAVSFLEGVQQLQQTAPGFTTEGRLYAHTALPASSGDRESRQEFYRQALERLRAVPGIERAALTSVLPLMPSGSECVSTAGAVELSATVSEVSEGYLATMGVPVIAGGEFTAASRLDEPESVIVSETLGRLAWPGESPIGKRIELGCAVRQPAVVVGVARDTAIRQIGERARPHLYRPIMRRSGGSFTTIILSASGSPASLAQPVRNALVGMGQGLRIYEVLPLTVPIEQSFAAPRWLTAIVLVLGALALILSAVGLFGVTAHRVSQRTKEIGVRMALGARRSQVFRQVIGDGVRTVAVGVGVGELLSVGLTGVAGTMAEGAAGAGGLSVHLAVAAIWLTVAASACYAPAAWASRVDPAVALRRD